MNLTDYWNISQTKNKNLLSQPSQYAQNVEKLLPRNSKILDIGGARGNDSIFFLSKGHIPTILDISTYARDEVTKRDLKIDFVTLNLKNTPYPFTNSIFDIVYSRLTLQYFKPSELEDILKEIKRLLKPEGKAYISVKSAQDKTEMSKLKKEAEELDQGVFISEGIIKTRYTHEQYKELIEKVGFNSYGIREISEKLDSPNKHGNTELLLTEIRLIM